MSVHADPSQGDCGWWPPGAGEPGKDWDFQPVTLELVCDGGGSIDVLMVTPEGPRALVSVPISAIAHALADRS